MKPVLIALAGVVCLSGCLGGHGCEDLATTLAAREAELSAAQRDLAALRTTTDAQAQQIQTLQGLGPDRLTHLFHVQRLRLGRFTGGVDLDGQPGDDAVKVYLEPLDQDGSVLKAAGDVTITLYDLTAGTRLATCTYTVNQLADHWRSGPLGNYFSFVCPLEDARPSGTEVTVRVTFVDYLTGKTFGTQTVAPFK